MVFFVDFETFVLIGPSDSTMFELEWDVKDTYEGLSSLAS